MKNLAFHIIAAAFAFWLGGQAVAAGLDLLQQPMATAQKVTLLLDQAQAQAAPPSQPESLGTIAQRLNNMLT